MTGPATRRVPGSRRAPGHPGRRNRRGMVTAELAVSILAAAILAAIGAWTVGLVALQGSCRSSASEIADQLARGDRAVAGRARDNVPSGAKVTTSSSGGWVTVSVSAQRSIGRVGPVTVVGTASSPLEPGETP